MTEVAGLEQREIAAQIGKLFVHRRDVKAVQHRITGAYARSYSKITMSDVTSHIRGESSIGHYLVGTDGLVKLFAFDIDLIKTNKVRPVGYWPEDPANEAEPRIQEFIPRDAWADRAHPSRGWTKFQMMLLATKLASVVRGDWNLRCLVAYSGSKGVHVYAFLPEPTPASEAREAGQMIMESIGWVPKRAGNNPAGGVADSYNPQAGPRNFWVCPDLDPVVGFPNFEIEVYPKQDEVRAGGFGNLMRLPLGRNYKAERDQAFIIDCRTPLGVMRPVKNVLQALHNLDPLGIGDNA